MEVKKLTQEFVDEFLGYYINPKNRLMNSLLIDSGLPGGMMGSLMNDLEKSHKSINKWLQKNNKKEISIDNLFTKLLDEVNFIWPILGYPPLVTPYSQYVKNVALVNVLNNIKGKNRWSLIDDNTWDMLLGKSGQLPGKLGDEIISLSKDLNKTFYDGVPHELVENILDKNREEMKERDWELGNDEEELLEFSLHKTQYIDYKSGVAKKKLADEILERKNNKPEEPIPSQTKKEIITIQDVRYEVEYLNEENNTSNTKNPPGRQILSPIEGRVFLTKDPKDTSVKVNDIVKKGDVICYIESMKVINAIKSEYSGKIVKVCIDEGDDVFDDDILFIIN
tara:strand:- start:9 stop:1019 length:1011 start_codon:yes stop_codon:yes gene_type:complete